MGFDRKKPERLKCRTSVKVRNWRLVKTVGKSWLMSLVGLDKMCEGPFFGCLYY